MILTPQQPDFCDLLFPGRSVLYVGEVAKKLEVCEQHVIDLIDEGKLHAINVGGNGRKFWRIPVRSYERFIKSRSSLQVEIPQRSQPSQPPPA